jgi:hypothetical protein
MSRKILIKITILVTLLYSVLTPPTLFAHMDFMSRDIRLVLGLISLFLIISNINKLSINVYGMYISIIVISLFIIEIIRLKSALNNILSFYIVLILSVAFYHAFNRNKIGNYIYITIWVKVGYFMSISFIMLFIIHQFTTFYTDFFNLQSLLNYSARNYNYSFLGVSQDKHYGYFTISRVSGYFPEPQYAAFYFIINIMVSRVSYVRNRYKSWGFVNLFAGLLTFSTTLYIVITFYYTLVYLSMVRGYYRNFLISSAGLFIFLCLLSVHNFIINILVDFLSYTSFSDRMIRINNALEILGRSSTVDFIFGHGVSFTGGSDRGLSIGIFHVLVERGIIGLLIVLSVMKLFIQRNRIAYFISLIYLLAFTWYVNPIYWFGLIALWSASELTKCKIMKTK